MEFNYGWFILMILSMRYSSVEGRTFFVSDYGAYPDDNLDDSNAIQSAINEAINYGSVSDIVFGNGIYSISSTILIFNATNLTVTGQGIDQTFLIGYNQVSIFFTQFCQGLKLTSFSIDYNPLPFTAGYVVNVDQKYLDVQVVPPHQTDVGRQVQAILRYDPVQMRPAFGPNTYEIYQTPSTDANTTIVSPGILRIPLNSPTKFGKGDPVVVRYAFVFHAIYGQDVTDITIQSITIYASWSMGFFTLRSKRLNVINYHVIPYNGRWMSSNVDCMHFADTREYVSISDSICQAMGDDGLNVHGVFFLVTELINSSAIIITGTNWANPLDVGVGTTLEFSGNQQPFTVHGSGTVASIVSHSTTSRIFIFTSPVNVSLNDWACVSDTPILTIRNFTVSHNRARGVLLETRNIDIRQSVFNRTSGPAVLIQPSMYWHEGPEARNVSLINNIYIDNNEGIAQEKGIITILPDPPQLVPVINDIQIESSTFYFGMYSQGLLQSDNVNNVFISGNYIVTNNLTSFISICNSRNISAENNCVVTNQTKLDQYYIFDRSNPCSMNLSSLINLPASAFNSSFPPPVVIKDLSIENHQHQFIKRKIH
jgi:hypothetical protein